MSYVLESLIAILTEKPFEWSEDEIKKHIFL